MDRREFLGGVGALGVYSAAGRREAGALEGEQAILKPGARSVRYSDAEMDVPDDGWHLWLDRKASWKDDPVYLPGDIALSGLPVNSPTGGWTVLNEQRSLKVTLPATVEQFFWGIDGFRPYKDEYKFEATDDEVKNGAYYGVSWWWREVRLPAGYAGRRVLLHVRGARQRAEVYLNGQLVGYSMLEELPFECDLTSAAKPGQTNVLAIRITNPGGRLDWVDNVRMRWGGVEFQKSHGFGGLDRGMVISAHDREVRMRDVWALNTPAAREIRAFAEVENSSGEALTGSVRFKVLEPSSGKVLVAAEVPLRVAGKSVAKVDHLLKAADAAIWDLDTPHLYRLRAEWVGTGVRAARETDFGFRWISVEGIGKNAIFRLNGRRIRIYTSISWGYWALNGLFPLPELAEKEVRTAKQLNLNTLNFHRNLGKEDVLYVQDRVGLMRCLEPGGGAQALLPSKDGSDTARRYMEAKITGMIRAFRSHPSVIHYIVQNETTLDPESAAVAAVFARMQDEDPSRTIVGNDGFVMRSPQAWSEPYATVLHKSGPKATLDGGAGGWWVDHTGHFSDVWQDTYYNSPEDFYYRSPIKPEIVEWGEMKGAASIDNHASVLRQIKRHGGTSYDLLDHQEQMAAYETFLDRWGFREAFPTTEKLFLSIGRRAYESWGQFMENVRICDENDMAAISGWESTAMENHSGLVDNFRDFKADPRSISESLIALKPLAKQHQLVVATGERARFDLYLLNDTDRAVEGELTLRLEGPGMKATELKKIAAPQFERDRLSYLLATNVDSPALRLSGTYTCRFVLNGDDAAAHRCEVLVVDEAPAGMRPLRIALASAAPQVEVCVKRIPGAKVEEFVRGRKYDVIVGSGGAAAASKNLAVDAEGAYKPGPGPLALSTLSDDVMDAVRGGTPLLAITPTDGQSVGVAQQLAKLGAFEFQGMVGPSRASWMGSWYFVRRHPIYDGMPVDQAMSIDYQVKGGGSNGWMVRGAGVEIAAGYGRDHDRNLGAGTFTAKVGSTKVAMHRMLDMHPVLLQRLIANAAHWLCS